ncbi:MAG: anti-sigma factor [Rhodanobacteraceae bacterium]
MNTPLDHKSEDLRCAEYVLGVLDAEERAAVEREIASDPRAADEAARWQRYLSSLAEDIPPAAPPAHVWTRIQDTLDMQAARHEPPAPAQASWWNNLSLWRGFAFGAAAVAVACIIALAVLPRPIVTRAPAPPTIAYMTSTISQTSGQVGWTAIVDLQQARMVVVPVQPQTIPASRAPELWLIPAGQKPIAVGVIAAKGATTIKLSPALAAKLGPTAALAVSIEPPGGSPTGQPTGPVIAKGAIAATAARSSGKPVATLYLPEQRTSSSS